MALPRACLALVMLGSTLVATAAAHDAVALAAGMLFLGMGSGGGLYKLRIQLTHSA
jgi:hypothetical protein